MENYINELRWKIIRAKNLLYQVTIEFRFWKSLAQERFKSNLEFRYRIIVSSILHVPCNYQLSKSMDHEIKFGDIAAMYI